MAVARGKAPSSQLYLIIGRDVQARRRRLEEVQAALAAAGGGPVDRIVIDGKEATLSQVGEAVETTPLFPGPRLVWIQDVDQARPEVLDYLASVLPPKVEQTVVVLTAPALDRRTKAARALEEKGKLLRVDPPAARDVPGWIREQARAVGLNVTPQAAALMHALVGDDTMALATELEKLAAAVQSGESITPAHVDRYVSRALPWAAEYALFELVDAVVEGRRQKAFQLLRQLLAAGKPPLLIVHMLARHYRLLVAACGRPRQSPEQLARDMEVNPFPARKAMTQARRLTLEAAVKGLEAIADADFRLKTSSSDPALVLDMLLGQLIALGTGKGR